MGLRWALIGASDIAATRMIPAFRENGGSISVVQSGSAAWAEEYAALHGIPGWTTSVIDAVSRSDVDAVYVSSTNEKHHDQVLAVAAAGKHCLAEKPLALSVADASAMVAACASAGVVLATNHHLPSSPAHRAMAELIASGAIGRVLSVTIQHANGLPPRLEGWRVHDPAGGGVLLDVFVHDMAACRALLGGSAASVTVIGVAPAADSSGESRSAFDDTMSLVEWTSGLGEPVLVQTHDSYTNFHLPTGIEIIGTDGALVGRDALAQDPIGKVFLVRGGEFTPVDLGPEIGLYDFTVARFEEAVAARAAGDATAQPWVTGEDGVISLAAALAGVESLRTGAKVPVVGV